MACSIQKPAKFPRVLAGLVLILLGIYFKSYWGILGIVPIIMAISGFCPLCYIKAKIALKRDLKG